MDALESRAARLDGVAQPRPQGGRESRERCQPECTKWFERCKRVKTLDLGNT